MTGSGPPGRQPRDRGARGSWSDHSLRAALALILVVAVVAAFAVVVVAHAYSAVLLVPMVVFAGIGLADVGLGVLAWSRRPHNRTGLLLCVAGFSILLAVAGNTDIAALRGLGFLTGQAPIAAIMHVLLAFPSGRLGSAPARLLATGGWLGTVGLDLVRFAASPQRFLDPAGNPQVQDALQVAQRSLGAALLLAASLYLVSGLRRSRTAGSPPAERRALAAVYAWGIGMLWFIPVSANVLAPLLGWDPLALFVAQITPLLAMPLVFAYALLRGGFARTGRVEELAASLAAPGHGHGSLQGAVAAALGDPSAAIVLPAPVTPPDPGRGRVLVRGEVGLLAAIEYDAGLTGDPRPVAGIAEVLSLVMQREHLLRQLVRSRHLVLESRARIVHAADAERRRVVADLHDVLQSRIVLAAMRAGALVESTTVVGTLVDGTPVDGNPVDGNPATPDAVHTAAAAIRQDLSDALAELRNLIQGLMPATLTDAGLRAAIEDLLDRAPLAGGLTWDDSPAADRLPDPVATTAYLITAECVTNTVKHAAATRVDVRVEVRVDDGVDVRVGAAPGHLRLTVIDDGRGGAVPTGPDGAGGLGLRSAADRAEVLGGTFVVTSPAGGGTRIDVVLPLPTTTGEPPVSTAVGAVAGPPR